MTRTAEVFHTPLRKNKRTRPLGAWTVVGTLNGEIVEKVTFLCRATAHRAVKQWAELATMPTEFRKVWK
jgi:hypothetical protein